MYNPPILSETRLNKLHDIIQTYPLGTLTVMTDNGLEANHLPTVLKPDQGEYGTIHCHVGKSNLVWNTFHKDTNALVIFTGPDCYISPKGYEAYHRHGKVAPSWNYIAVHASGPMNIITDKNWMHNHLSDMTDANESKLENPWKITDAPADYLAKSIDHLIGLEIPIKSLTGKWQLSQNRKMEDRISQVENLRARNTPNALAIADHMEETFNSE